MTNPTVSVLTTCYNRERYLGECIESVLNGHYQDFELIIVDDRSSDNSLQIAHSYAEKDERIRVYQNEQNLGDYPNRNQAASYARGKYIKYLDADDMHGRFMLDIMVDAMEQFPDAGFGLFNANQELVLFPKLIRSNEMVTAHYSGSNRLFNRSPLTGIIKKEAFDSLGGFTGERMIGDFQMWHLLSLEFDCVIFSDRSRYYRVHNEQEMSLHREDPKWTLLYLLYSEKFLSDTSIGIDSASQEQFFSANQRKIARLIARSALKLNISKFNELKSLSKKTTFQIIKDCIR